MRCASGWLRFLAASVLAGVAGRAYGGFANDYAVFGGNSVTFQGYAWIKGGPVGSNGNVSTYGPAGVELDDLRVGGNLNLNPPVTTPSHITAHGDVTVNGTAAFGVFSEVFGAVNAGSDLQVAASATYHGNVTTGGALNGGAYNTFGGNVLAQGNVTFSNGTQVSGTVGSNGAVTAGLSTTFTGKVTNPSTFSMGSFSSNPGGHVTGTVGVSPATVAPVGLPPATAFTSGGANVTLNTFDDVTLSPGKYGTLTMNGSTTLRLSGGNYYFDSITAPGTFQDLYLDTTHGPINVFVSGDVNFKRLYPYVNGIDYELDSTHQIDPSLAGNVLLESHGNVNLIGDFFGTIFAPTGDITTGTIGSVTGSLVAGHDAIIGSSNSVSVPSSYVPSAYLAAAIPEPGTVGMVVIGAGAMVLGRRRRR